MTSTTAQPAPHTPASLAPGDAWFDSRGSRQRSSHGQGRIFHSPIQSITAATPDEVAPALKALDAAHGAGYWAAGYISFEAGIALEPRLAQLPERPVAEGGALPLLQFSIFERCQLNAAKAMDQTALNRHNGGHRLSPLVPSQSRAAYQAKVARALEFIAAGDIYQVNLTFPLTGRLIGDPLSLFAALRAQQPVAHGAVLNLGDHVILSVSPELFVERQGQRLIARPMKGTIGRGKTVELDHDAKQRLLASKKDRAENLMIVDLLRNDLSKVCVPGSVHVPHLFDLETYPTLHALTSTIEGEVCPDLGMAEIMSALFPCGSITGAPKIRAMEVIAELEETARGAYTGAIGWIAPDGDFSFNVAIRTMTVSKDGLVVYPVGAGIVADSDPAAEFEECILKAKVMADEAAEFELIETFRWTPASGFEYGDAHLKRLEASARYFHFSYSMQEIEAALQAATDGESKPLRVRLTLAPDGRVTVTHTALTQTDGPKTLRLCLAATPIDAGDPYLRHKTTRRAPYDAALAAAHAAGADEVLFANQYGELTEGAWSNLFVDMGDGCLRTPPLSAGLLPGILRAELLAKGEAREFTLTLSDLRSAKAIYMGNSVRGLMPAVLKMASTQRPPAEAALA